MNYAALVGWVALMAFFFAKVEIHIEGDAGWAASLPTWRIKDHPILKYLTFGRDLTGYHFWMLSFMALAFHLPIFMTGEFSVLVEVRILACFALFFVFEDFLWFVFNPHYGLRRFNPKNVPWHRYWLWRVPADYIAFLFLGALGLWFSAGTPS